MHQRREKSLSRDVRIVRADSSTPAHKRTRTSFEVRRSQVRSGLKSGASHLDDQCPMKTADSRSFVADEARGNSKEMVSRSHHGLSHKIRDLLEGVLRSSIWLVRDDILTWRLARSGGGVSPKYQNGVAHQRKAPKQIDSDMAWTIIVQEVAG